MALGDLLVAPLCAFADATATAVGLFLLLSFPTTLGAVDGWTRSLALLTAGLWPLLFLYSTYRGARHGRYFALARRAWYELGRLQPD